MVFIIVVLLYIHTVIIFLFQNSYLLKEFAFALCLVSNCMYCRHNAAARKKMLKPIFELMIRISKMTEPDWLILCDTLCECVYDAYDHLWKVLLFYIFILLKQISLNIILLYYYMIIFKICSSSLYKKPFRFNPNPIFRYG